MVVKLSISLTDQQAEYARAQVEAGRFSSTSAVIQQALEAKRREDEAYEAWKAGFEAEMIRRIDGPHVPIDEFHVMVDEMLAEKRRQYGVEN